MSSTAVFINMLCWKNCGLLLLVMSRVTKTEKLVTAHNWVQATWQIYKGFSWCYCVLFYLAKFQVYIPFFIIVIDEMVLMTFWAVELPGTVSCLKKSEIHRDKVCASLSSHKMSVFDLISLISTWQHLLGRQTSACTPRSLMLISGFCNFESQTRFIVVVNCDIKYHQNLLSKSVF